MKESVYLEPSFISYVVSRSGPEPSLSANQQLSWDWWTKDRNGYICYVSEAVLEEIREGDPAEAAKRENLVRDLSILGSTGPALKLSQELLLHGLFPDKSVADAIHLAIAIEHRIDSLLTWNCRHLANPHVIRRIEDYCFPLGHRLPVICTPRELRKEETT